jgi:ATP-dependent Clp protease protease subunit
MSIQDELYTSTSAQNANYNYKNTKTNNTDDPYKDYFREFDYGIDLTDNVIVICDEIQMGLLPEFIAKVRLLKKVNNDLTTVNILLNSGGGDVVETLGIIDYIRGNKDIKFNVICRGIAMSAAALLLAAGTGVRAASKHSKIMVHQLSTFAAGKLSDVKSNAKFADKLEEECNTMMAEFTKKPKEWWESNQQSDLFLTAEDALNLGIIDKII